MKTNIIEISKRRFAILIAGFLLTLGSSLFFGYYSYLMSDRAKAYEKLSNANYELAQRHLRTAQEQEIKAIEAVAESLIERRKAEEALINCKGR